MDHNYMANRTGTHYFVSIDDCIIFRRFLESIGVTKRWSDSIPREPYQLTFF